MLNSNPLLSNPLNGQPSSLIPNPFANMPSQQPAVVATLGLTQIENFEPVPRFTDSAGVTWTLVKAATNATVEVPDPRGMQVLDCWDHAVPGVKQKVYVYVVEGIKQPRVETERPARILYQWFSTTFAANFTPAMITDKEWMKANVYAAPVVDTRVSKLNALCHVAAQEPTSQPAQQEELIRVEELSHGADPGRDQKAD